VRHILGRAVLPKGSLCMEVTEALVMENPERATQVLSQLAAAGASLALDDFGTGYSSLSYLNQFTFDTIKVDRAFIQASGQNGTGSVILRSIVALSHELGKKVVAEGVETEEDVGFLRSINCEYGQGFYYGEPMSEREVMQLLRVVRKAERRMKKGLFRRSRMPEMPAMQTAAAEPEAAAEPRVPIPAPEQRPAPPVSNGAALPIATATRTRPPLPPRPAGPMPTTPMMQQASGKPPLPGGPALPGGPPLPTGRTPPTTPSSRPKPPPIPGARQLAPAEAGAAKVNLPPTPLRPGATPALSATATLAAALEQQPQATNGSAAAGNGASSTRSRPGPPPLPRTATPEPPRTGDAPQRPEPRPTPTPPRPAPTLTPQQLRSNGNGPNGKPGPDLSKLPPNIAESLAKLAGRSNVPFLGADTPTTPATADTAETGGKPQRDT
jgi:hypothetical protein